MHASPHNFRVTVNGTSLCAYCEYEEHAINEARRMAALTGCAALVVQLLPEYRVVDEIRRDRADATTRKGAPSTARANKSSRVNI